MADRNSDCIKSDYRQSDRVSVERNGIVPLWLLVEHLPGEVVDSAGDRPQLQPTPQFAWRQEPE